MSSPAAGWKYARDVVAGDIVAGELVTLACQRALDDLASPGPWVYSEEHANHFIQFCQFIKHVKGPMAGESFDIEPWQAFIFTQIFGWRSAANPKERKYRECLVEVARKNGKSFFSSALSLYELLFGDEGAEIYSVATKQDQARIVWESAGAMASKMDERLSGRIAQTVSAITCKDRFSTFKALGRDSKSLDGLNPSMVIIDEAGAITDRNVIEVMTSAVGARLSPLIVYITTAYFSKATAYYEKRMYVESVLKGEFKDDRVFGMIYTLDAEDNFEDKGVWRKANPNLGVSLQEDYLESMVSQAKAILAQRPGVLVKHFDIWQSSSEAWVDTKFWEASAGQVERSGRCFVGLDLAQTRDLCAATRVWDNGGGQFSVDFQTWLPRSAVANAPPHIRPIYQTAIDTGILKITEGETTDYREIEQYIRKTCRDFSVGAVCCDPYNATQLVNSLEDDGLPVMMVRQGISHLSPASKETEVWITEGKLVHDGNPFILWQLQNAHVHVDVNDNIKVRKGDDPNLKIDSIIALIMAVSAAAGNAEAEKSVSFNFIEF